MKGWSIAALVVAASACSSDDQSIRIERQPSTLAAAKADAWVAGSAVLIGEPGAFTFPQAVSVRIMLVDSDAAVSEDMPLEPKLVSMAKATVFGDGVGEITENITCQPDHCDAEVTLSASGLVMLQLTAQNTDGEEADCFYYGVYEETDPVAAGDVHREAAEAREADCERDLFD